MAATVIAVCQLHKPEACTAPCSRSITRNHAESSLTRVHAFCNCCSFATAGDLCCLLPHNRPAAKPEATNCYGVNKCLSDRWDWMICFTLGFSRAVSKVVRRAWKQQQSHSVVQPCRGGQPLPYALAYGRLPWHLTLSVNSWETALRTCVARSKNATC